ncbi:hypothetical protein GYMLUDRAFT_86765 [Collybiopsis luxurians FD-317 M1]|uniref:Uncharacterized protein n=1 Tax=Collybiopsis luxurians FD-317 M1 TaxID=944289 RepID=A0A0D0C560_9AGAR|nr:hypothetical protein GYMLUDRAFT_86765 [Collybiopsis luxurians FD-317 M1]
MRTLDFKSTTRVLVRFRSTRAIETEGSSKAKLPHPPSTSFSSHICSLDSSAPPTAPFTPLSPLIVPEVIGVLAGPEAGGVPPYAAAYPISRHRKPLPAHSRRYTNDIPLRQKDKSEQTGLVPPSPQQLWTRAFTLASKDVKNVTSKALVYFLERGKAHYRPWVPPTLQTRESLGKNGDTGLSATIGTSESARVVPPVLQYSVRLTLSHYTALIHGLLLRRHYSVALEWVRKLIYPFPSTFSPRASALFPNTNSILLSRTTKHPRDAVHFALDGPALSACLVVLARLGRVHEAVKVLEAYAAPTMIARKSRHASNVQMNTIQMNDFLLVLLRWPSKKHALPVPSVQFPLKPLKVKRTRRPAASEGRTDTSVEHLSVSTGTTRSARPDLLLRLLPALYPRYGVTWDARTVCLMLQAVRMSAKMDGVSAFGLRKVLKEMFVGRGLLHPREPPMMESRSLAAQSLREDSKQWWFVERIMEVLWKPVDSESE